MVAGTADVEFRTGAISPICGWYHATRTLHTGRSTVEEHREERLDSHEVLHFRSYLIGEPQVGAASYKKHRSRRVLRAKS